MSLRIVLSEKVGGRIYKMFVISVCNEFGK